MSGLDLGPIKERAATDDAHPYYSDDEEQAIRDRAALVAEVERLRAALSAERERCARSVESYANADSVEALIAAAAAEIRGKP